MCGGQATCDCLSEAYIACDTEQEAAETCPVCQDEYVAIAREKGTQFGILQCNQGHHLCKGCWTQLKPRVCPCCRANMSQPAILRYLQNKVLEQPAECKWPRCELTELTLGSVTEHEQRCSCKPDSRDSRDLRDSHSLSLVVRFLYHHPERLHKETYHRLCEFTLQRHKHSREELAIIEQRLQREVPAVDENERQLESADMQAALCARVI